MQVLKQFPIQVEAQFALQMEEQSPDEQTPVQEFEQAGVLHPELQTAVEHEL